MYNNSFTGGKNLMEGARILWPFIYDTIAGRQYYHYDTIARGKNLGGGGSNIMVHRYVGH